jgi:hypothetical protein
LELRIIWKKQTKDEDNPAGLQSQVMIKNPSHDFIIDKSSEIIERIKNIYRLNIALL